MSSVPNLFLEHSERDATRLYSMYLSRLMANARERRVVEACQQIKKYATRLKQPRSADFTRHFEIDALCKLRRFPDAWNRLRRLEHIAFGKNISLGAKQWTPEQLDWFWSYHPQILYFLGRYQIAGTMLEALLSERIAHPEEGLSYQLLPYVYKPVARPRDRHDVTLYHIYRKEGKKLTEWGQWEQFVCGFSPKLFNVALIEREDLLRDGSLFRSFYEAIDRERKKRLAAGISEGERELIDSPEEIERSQNDIAIKRALQVPVVAQSEKQLQEIFPELQHLRKKGTA